MISIPKLNNGRKIPIHPRKHTMHNFKELKTWQEGIDLVLEIYRATGKYPHEEKFGLTSQMRRCAVSIPSNIAEGAGRSTDKSFAHFLDISYGSSCELETQMIISLKLGFISNLQFKEIEVRIHRIQKMIFNFKKVLEKRISK
jgi:four helix bundle protein